MGVGGVELPDGHARSPVRQRCGRWNRCGARECGGRAVLGNRIWILPASGNVSQRARKRQSVHWRRCRMDADRRSLGPVSSAYKLGVSREIDVSRRGGWRGRACKRRIGCVCASDALVGTLSKAVVFCSEHGSHRAELARRITAGAVSRRGRNYSRHRSLMPPLHNSTGSRASSEGHSKDPDDRASVLGIAFLLKPFSSGALGRKTRDVLDA